MIKNKHLINLRLMTMSIDNNHSPTEERIEKAQEKRRIPKYILFIVALFLIAIIVYMLSTWRG